MATDEVRCYRLNSATLSLVRRVVSDFTNERPEIFFTNDLGPNLSFSFEWTS